MKRSFLYRFSFIAAAGLVLAACAGGSSLQIEDAWIRPALEGNNAAVYFMLNNNTGADDTLLGASADVARAVEIHESMSMDMSDEMDRMGAESDSEGMDMGGDVMEMVPLDDVPVPGDDQVVFEPGGKHVMLIGVDHDLQAGEVIPIVLHFQNAGDISVNVSVENR